MAAARMPAARASAHMVIALMSSSSPSSSLGSLVKSRYTICKAISKWSGLWSPLKVRQKA